MNDARISPELPAHPKTKKLIRRLGEGAAWRLVCLHLWTASNRPNGNLAGMTAEDIELAVDWAGEPDAFVDALVAVGFLDQTTDGYSLHDWAQHQPWVAGSTARSQKARWNAHKRHHGEAAADREVPEYAAIRFREDASSNASSNAETKTSNAPSPSPSPSPKALDTPKLSETPKHSSRSPRARENDDSPSEVGKLLVQAGATPGKFNLSHPVLLNALEQGVTAQAIADTYTEGASSGKASPYLWAINTALNRHLEAPKHIAQARDGPSAGRQQNPVRTSATRNGINNLLAGTSHANDMAQRHDQDRAGEALDAPARRLPSR